MPISRRHLLSSAAATVLCGASQPGPAYSLAMFRVDVTCPIGHPLLARRQGVAKEIADPLYAHGVVFLGCGKPVVLAAVDWCEIRNDAYDRWRDLLAEAAGTSRERVLLCSVHQHDAPLADLGAQQLLTEAGMPDEMLDVDFFEQTGHRIAAEMQRSMDDARPVTHIGLGRSKIEKIASNRRVVLADGTVTFGRNSNGARDLFNREAPDGLIDPWLRTISFWEQDEPVAALSAYATHPMSYYGKGEVSADFVGMARAQRHRDNPSIHQIYVSGCSGDITAGKYNDASRANRPVLANRLYRGMTEAWEATERMPLRDVVFRTTKFDLPFRSSEQFTTSAMRNILESRRSDRKDRVLAAMGLSTRQRLANGHKIDLPCLDLGSAQIVLLPGEAFVGYQLLAQQQRPDSFVVSMGYGECWPGYLPTETAFRDGFNGPWLWVAPGAELRIREAMKRVLPRQQLI